MAPKKPTPEEFRLKVLGLVRGSGKPVLVGPVALELDCSLAQAERALLALTDEGLLRHVNASEQYHYDIRDGFVAV